MTTKSGFIFRSGRVCCIPGCSNREYNNSSCEYYTFPGRKYEFDRKRRWVNAVRKVMKDKSWTPNRNTRICSAHFAGGKKSTIESDKAYIPTIFPPTPKQMDLHEVTLATWCAELSEAETPISDMTDPLAEGDLTIKDEQGVTHCPIEQEQVIAEDSLLVKQEEELIISDDELGTNFEVCIVNTEENTSKSNLTVGDEEVCTKTGVSEANTEEDPLKTKTTISLERIDAIIDSCKAGTDDNLSKYRPKHQCKKRGLLRRLRLAKRKCTERPDASISPVESSNQTAEKPCEVPRKEVSVEPQKIQGFMGLEGVAGENELRQLAGVSADTFKTLLKLQESGERKTRVDSDKESNGTKVRMLTMEDYKQHIKIENALLLFLMKIKDGLSLIDLGRVFNVPPHTAAKVFLIFLNVLADCTESCICWPAEESLNKDNFPSIASIEVTVDDPEGIEPRILMYSGRDGVSTVKFLIAITSDGVICKVSKLFGGRVSNEYIATHDWMFSNFSEHEVQDGKIPPEKIQVQNAIDRVKDSRILNQISMSMLPHLTAIVHMCCVVANSQLQRKN